MKIALNRIIILIFFVMGGISESLAQNQNFLYYDDNYIKNLNISWNSWINLKWATEDELIKLKQNNVDTRAIEIVIQNSVNVANNHTDLPKAYQLILEAREMTLKAGKMILEASLSDTINKVNLEINNATSIGADTKAAVAKLEEAKKALSDGNYANASLFANEAYNSARVSNVDIGYRPIKDLMSLNADVYSKYQPHKVIVETGGFIRDIKSSGASYSFIIDDGNGVISVFYSGGLGDIKEGDTVNVKGVYNFNHGINAESVKKGSGLVGSSSSNIKAPGFEAIIAVIGFIGALWLRRKL